MSIFHGSVRISRPAVWGLTAFCVMAGLCSQLPAAAAQGKTPEKPDTIVFTNGDQLTGKLERGVGDSIVFKSDTAGEITVPVKKLKELRSFNNFAVIRKEDKKKRKATSRSGKNYLCRRQSDGYHPDGSPSDRSDKGCGFHHRQDHV